MYIFDKLNLKYELLTIISLLLYLSEVSIPGPFNNYFNLIAYAITLLLILVRTRPGRLLYIMIQDPFLLMLVIFASCSFIWSAAPEASLNDIRPVLRTYLLGAYIALRFTPKQQLTLYSWVLGIASFLSISLPFIIPGYGISGKSYLWKGIYRHKSSLGRIMSFSVATFLLTAKYLKKNRVQSLIFLCISLLLVIVSGSKTSLILLAVLACLIPFKDYFRQKYKEKVFVLVFTIFLTGFFASLILNNIEFIVIDTFGKDLTFSGRTDLWDLCLDKFYQRPWLGYGHAAFWKSPESIYVFDRLDWGGEYQGINTGMHAHSGFIDFLLQYGMVGLFLLLASFLRLLSKLSILLSLSGELAYFWYFIFLFIFIITNINLTNTLLTGNLLWVIYVSSAISTALYERKLKAKPKIHSFSHVLTW